MAKIDGSLFFGHKFLQLGGFFGSTAVQVFPLGATAGHALPLESALGAAWVQSPPSENILRAAVIYTLLLENISPASGTRKPSLEIILWATVIHTPPSENILRAAVIWMPPLEIPMGTADRRALLSENIGVTRAGRLLLSYSIS